MPGSTEGRNLILRPAAHTNILMLLCLCLAAAVRTGCPQEAGDDYKSVRTFALRLQQQGASSEAIACYKKAALIDAARPEPWLSIGEIYRASGDNVLASDLQRVLRFLNKGLARR